MYHHSRGGARCDKINPMPKDPKAEKFAADQKRFTIRLWSLHLLAVLLLGAALFPAIAFFYGVWKAGAAWPVAVKLFVFSLSVSLGYFIFGTALIFLCVGAKSVLGFRIRPGLYAMYSPQALDWMSYNSLVLLANAAFLDVLRISPFQTLFYRLMGAKVGVDVNVNTGGLADLSMLDIGDHVVIGGGSAIICHAVERGFLRLETTRIGDRVSIGLGSVVMPGCVIGEGASIAPCTYLPKGTQIPPRGYWGGNPARDLRAERRLVSQNETEGSD